MERIRVSFIENKNRRNVYKCRALLRSPWRLPEDLQGLNRDKSWHVELLAWRRIRFSNKRRVYDFKNPSEELLARRLEFYAAGVYIYLPFSLIFNASRSDLCRRDRLT